MKTWIKAAVAAIALSAATVQAATEVKVGMSGRYFPFTFCKARSASRLRSRPMG
ncbi:hypothetical protein QW180_09670 [Vibrio sinaloensis]|nr:hypothetical protein [Vibrio sinaloensis]